MRNVNSRDELAEVLKPARIRLQSLQSVWPRETQQTLKLRGQMGVVVKNVAWVCAGGHRTRVTCLSGRTPLVRFPGAVRAGHTSADVPHTSAHVSHTASAVSLLGVGDA